MKIRRWRPAAAIAAAVAGILLVFATYVFFDGSPVPLFVGLGLLGAAFAIALTQVFVRREGEDRTSADRRAQDSIFGFYQKLLTAAIVLFSALVVTGIVWRAVRPQMRMFVFYLAAAIVMRIAWPHLARYAVRVREGSVSKRRRVVISILALLIAAVSVVFLLRLWFPPVPHAIGAKALIPLVLRSSDLPSSWDADTTANLAQLTKTYAAEARCYGMSPPSFASSPTFFFDTGRQDGVFARAYVLRFRREPDLRLWRRKTSATARCIEALDRDAGIHTVQTNTLPLPRYSGERYLYRTQGRLARQDRLWQPVGRSLVYLRFATYGGTLPQLSFDLRIMDLLVRRAEAHADVLSLPNPDSV